MEILKLINYKELNIWDSRRVLLNENIFKKNVNTEFFKNVLNKIATEIIHIENEEKYSILGVRSYGKGVFISRTVFGKELKMKKYQKSLKNTLFWCKVDTKNGAFGVVTEKYKNTFASSNMTFAEINLKRLNPEYLQILFQIKKFNKYMDNFTNGTTNRRYVKIDTLMSEILIPVLTLKQQNKMIVNYNQKIELAKIQENKANEIGNKISAYLFNELDIQIIEQEKVKSILANISFSDINYWGVEKNIIKNKYQSTKIKPVSLEKDEQLYSRAFRGKSPKYSNTSRFTILNQKCNRWNSLEMEHSKTVDEEWFKNISKEFFTQEGDIIINSTGEGTIGRATCITKNYENLLYDSHILLLRVNKNKINSLYLTYFINSEIGQEEIENIKSAQTTKQTELGITNLKRLNLYLPSLEIQNEIANEITKLKDEKNKLEREAKINRKKALEEFEKEIFI